jgi:multidrug efflux pump subunit AcrB
MNADLHRDLPPGAHITVVNDLPRSVRGRIAEFNTNLLSGVVLIIGVLYLFMGLRSALIVGIMLPITMLGTFALMYVFGRDLQQISITALIISVGLVVDNSIVVIDNIERKLSEGMNGERAVIEGVDQVRVPLLTSNLTTVASFAPLLLLSGSVGEFIRDLGIVTSLATLVSLLLNYTIAPLIALRFLKGSHEDRPNSVRRAFLRGVDCLRESTSWLAAGALRRARLTVSAAIALLCLTAALVPHLGMQFFPSAVRNQFQIDINLPEGRDIQATSRVASRVEAIVRAHQGIESVTSYIGQGGPRFYYNVNQEAPNPAYAQVVVNIDNADRAHALVDAIQSEANHTIADARVTVKSLEQGPPIGPPIAIRLSGTNISELRSAGEKLKEVLNGTPGAASVYQDYDEPRLTLHAAVNEEQARLAGVSSQSVADAVRMGFSGLEVSTLRDGDREIPIELRAVPEERSDAASIGDMPVVGESGTVVPLRQVAALSLAPEESRIMRRNHVRTLTVFAYTDGSRLASDILGEVRRRLPSLNLPQSVAVSYGGEQEEAGRSFTELILVMGVTIAANLVIVVWEFNSFPVALTILAAIPLSLIGAIFGLYCMGLPFGFIAFIGIVGLGGIVTNHAIVLFEYAQAEQRAGHPLDEALVVAGRRRLRPILLTVLLSIFGLLPQAVNGGTLWPPLAWAQIFGLLASLVLTLAVVPSVYKVLSMRRRREIATERVPAAQLPEQQASGVR